MTTVWGNLTTVESLDEVDPARHGTLEVLTGGGDVKKLWDRNNADEVADARRSFEELTGKGFAAFAVAKGGGREGRMTAFDPAAEGYILVPQIRGGR